MSSEKHIIQTLTGKGWELADSEHPLGGLQGKSLNSSKLVILLGPKNRNGANYFQLFLQNAEGELSLQPVIVGLHSQGKYPAYNWIEISQLLSEVSFQNGNKVDIYSSGLIQKLFKYLVSIIPPGGHFMVEYESSQHEETMRALTLGVPPVATPLGYIMFLGGCDAGFKDWYFAEGG